MTMIIVITVILLIANTLQYDMVHMVHVDS